MPDTLLVLGSNGLVGQKVMAQLAGRAAVQAVGVGRTHNRNPAALHQPYERVDLTDESAVAALFERYRPTVVINSAGMTAPDACEQNPSGSYLANVHVVKLLLKQCAAHGSHLVQLSTDHVFDGLDGPYSETATPNPLNLYGLHKLEAEELVRASAVPHAILRTVLLYGTSNDPSRGNFVRMVRDRLRNGEPLRVVHDQYRTPTLAEDFAEAVVRAALMRATGLWHLAGTELMSVHELAVRVARFFSLNPSGIEAVSTDMLNEPAPRPRKSGFIILKAQTELGFRPRKLEEGLAVLARQLGD